MSDGLLHSLPPPSGNPLSYPKGSLRVTCQVHGLMRGQALGLEEAKPAESRQAPTWEGWSSQTSLQPQSAYPRRADPCEGRTSRGLGRGEGNLALATSRACPGRPPRSPSESPEGGNALGTAETSAEPKPLLLMGPPWTHLPWSPPCGLCRTSSNQPKGPL